MNPIINYFTNIPIGKLIARLLVSLVLLCLVASATVFAWDYFVTQKVVTLDPSLGTTIAIGNQSGKDPVISSVILSTTSTKQIRLHPGTYALKFSGSKDYQEELVSILVNKSMEIKTPTLKYTDDKLSQLLVSEKASIHQYLQPFMPDAGYKIGIEKLFNTGQWYSASLIPGNWYSSTNAQDMLRVIMKKENGQWKVEAGPSIVIYIGDYPNIPQDIIKATNKLGFYVDMPSGTVKVTNGSVINESVGTPDATKIEALIKIAVLYNISISNDPNAPSIYVKLDTFNNDVSGQYKIFKHNTSYTATIEGNSLTQDPKLPWNYWFSIKTNDGRQFKINSVTNDNGDALLSVSKIN